MTAAQRSGRFSSAAGSALFAPLWADMRHTGVFLDLDGVLAPIAPRPELAAVPEPTVVLVRRLLHLFALVAIVSGRGAGDVRRMIDVPQLTVVGNHGAEVWLFGKAPEAEEHLLAGRIALIDGAACELERDPRLAAAGVRLERKGLSVALHTRGAGERAAAIAAEAAAAVAARHGLEILRGRAVVDLRFPGRTKGSAVSRLVRTAGLTAALYVGDDGTDLDAFAALDRLRRESGVHGVKVGVASDEGPAELGEAADVMIEFDDVPAMLAVLADEARRRRDTSGAKGAR